MLQNHHIEASYSVRVGQLATRGAILLGTFRREGRLTA